MIRTVAVGLLAVATLAAASALIRRNRVEFVPESAGDTSLDVNELYAAGL